MDLFKFLIKIFVIIILWNPNLSSAIGRSDEKPVSVYCTFKHFRTNWFCYPKGRELHECHARMEREQSKGSWNADNIWTGHGKREGRLGTSVCLRPVEWQKSQLACCLHCRRPVHLHTRFPSFPASNELFIEDQAFRLSRCRMSCLLPTPSLPSPVRKVSLFLSLPSRAYWREMGGG